MKETKPAFEQLKRENEDLRLRLQEAQDTIDAIRGGEVDALVVNGPSGEQIFSLKGADHSYRVLIEEMNEGAITLSEEGSILYANKFIEKLMGIPLEKILGTSIEHYVVPPDIDAFNALLHSGKTDHSSAEIHVLTANGAALPVYVSSTRISLDDAPVFCITVTELTDQKRHEYILSQERLGRNIIDQSADAVIICDARGVVIRTSKSAYDLIGENPLQAHFDEAFSLYFKPYNTELSEQESGFKRFTINHIVGGTQLKSCESYIQREGIVDNHLLLSAVPLTDRDKNIIGAIVNLTDITEKIKLETQLRQSQKMESIGLLAGGIAHDFNNILASIMGFTELAIEDAQTGSIQEDNLHEVYTASKRARDLVWQILAFARQTDEPTKPIQIGSLAREVLKLIRSSIPTTIEIGQTIESDALVMGDATEVHQVLMNLLTNAAHAMEETGGTLSCELYDIVLDQKRGSELNLQPGNYVRLKISDTGCGIAPEISNSVFEPYFTTKGVGEGTGMGLAMVQGIVDKYGGIIFFESNVGSGTTFSIYLPATLRKPHLQSYEPKEVPRGNERILVVDDEASIAKMISLGLERAGYSVSTTTSSTDALELFRSRPNDFDLVITDMTMPIMTGDVLAAEMLEIRPDIPIVVCTGYTNRFSVADTSATGIRAFVNKPIVKSELSTVVRKVLDQEIQV